MRVNIKYLIQLAIKAYIFRSIILSVILFNLGISIASAQCPGKDVFSVQVNNSLGNHNLEININNKDNVLNNPEIELLEINVGKINLDLQNIRLRKEGDRYIFENVLPGEYIIKVTINNCVLYLDKDKKGSGFIVADN